MKIHYSLHVLIISLFASSSLQGMDYAQPDSRAASPGLERGRMFPLSPTGSPMDSFCASAQSDATIGSRNGKEWAPSGSSGESHHAQACAQPDFHGINSNNDGYYKKAIVSIVVAAIVNQLLSKGIEYYIKSYEKSAYQLDAEQSRNRVNQDLLERQQENLRIYYLEIQKVKAAEQAKFNDIATALNKGMHVAMTKEYNELRDQRIAMEAELNALNKQYEKAFKIHSQLLEMYFDKQNLENQPKVKFVEKRAAQA